MFSFLKALRVDAAETDGEQFGADLGEGKAKARVQPPSKCRQDVK